MKITKAGSALDPATPVNDQGELAAQAFLTATSQVSDLRK
jgi:hypothetical protein